MGCFEEWWPVGLGLYSDLSNLTQEWLAGWFTVEGGGLSLHWERPPLPMLAWDKRGCVSCGPDVWQGRRELGP